MASADSLTKPDYRALLEAGARARARRAEDPELIDEDPREGPEGGALPEGLRNAHRRKARAHLAQVVRDRAEAGMNERFLEALEQIALDPAGDPMHRIAAMRTYWDRGYGRPAQLHQVDATITAGASSREARDALQHLDDEVLVAAVEVADMLKARVLLKSGNTP